MRKIVMAAMALLLLPQLCLAESENRIAKYYKSMIPQVEATIQQQQQDLQSASPDQWSDADVIAYLSSVNWLIYDGLNAYVYENQRLPESLDDMVVEGFIGFHPLNPLNGWQPVQFHTLSDGFLPGDIVLETAPSDFYSMVGSFDSGYALEPLSFQVGIYAKDEQMGRPVKPLKENTWATGPSGMVLYLGTFSETANQTLEKIRQAATDNTKKAGK